MDRDICACVMWRTKTVDPRSDAKKIKGVTVFLCAAARPLAEARCSPAIRFCNECQRTLALAQLSGLDLGAPCRKKSTDVYKCRAKMELLARLSESFIVVSDG